VKTARADETILYTPFPDYELTDPPGTGANTLRTTYRLAGQIVAVKTRTGTSGTGKLYFTFTDHLGNVAGLGEGSTFTSGSLARLDPFGNYRTVPSTNPTVTNQGFMGHRHNNTGTYDLGLIYMNARTYLPEVGRFISPDTLVPNPGNSQSHNRYSYVLNSPVNYTDPSGHL
jgi:RHS repeat-associated protein